MDPSQGVMKEASLAPGCVTYQPPGAVDREFLVYFSIFLAPDPWKMPARKSHCDHFAPIFVPRSLTASQIWLGIIFQKNVENCIIVTKKNVLFLQKHDFNIFWRNWSFIRPLSLEPRRKMTAIGLSSYQLFTKTLNFDRQNLNFPSVFDIFWKEHVRFYEKVIFWF